MKLPSKVAEVPFPDKTTPLPLVAIVLLAIVALPVITRIPLASTPNPSWTDSLPCSEEVKTNLLPSTFKTSVLAARPVV